MKYIFFVILISLVGGLLMGATILGSATVFTKVSSPGTCDDLRKGGIVQMNGGASEGTTKLCVCRSDGAASPAYQWCKLEISDTAAVVCTGGSSTVCP